MEWESFNLVTGRTWHFAGLKFISQDFSHCSSLERSSCRMFASDNELIARYMAVSAAKSLTPDRTCSGRSLIYARKRMGPRTEPCGTPEDTGMLSELITLITTDCILLSKKPLIHFSVSPHPECRKSAMFEEVFHGQPCQKLY